MNRITKLTKILNSKCKFCKSNSMKSIFTVHYEEIENNKIRTVLNELEFDKYSIINDSKIKFIHPESENSAEFDILLSQIRVNKDPYVMSADELIKTCKCEEITKVYYYSAKSFEFTGMDIITSNNTISFYVKEQQFSMYHVPQNDIITSWQFSIPSITVKCQADEFITLFKTKENIQNFCILN